MADKNIKITIRDRRAIVEGSPVIVCGNSGYTVTFAFDDEWDQTGARTARFVYVKDGIVQHEDVVFSGDVAAVPILSNVAFVKVGVFAGNLCTTTPAHINCELSILCGSGRIEEPAPDVYNQIMALINEMAEKGAGGATEEQMKRVADNEQAIQDLIDGTVAAGNAKKLNGLTAEEFVSNENLLINPDFKNPVNSSGKTSWNGNGTLYTFDKWILEGSSAVTLVLDESGATISLNGALNGSLIYETKNLLVSGEKYTISVKYNGEVYTRTITGGGYITGGTALNDTLKLYYISANGRIYLRTTSTSPVVFEWVKLEKGSVATPFIPPNKEVEKLKCGVADYLPLTGGTLSGDIKVTKATAKVTVDSTTVPHPIALESANTGNAGLYDYLHRKWIIKSDKDGKVSFGDAFNNDLAVERDTATDSYVRVANTLGNLKLIISDLGNKGLYNATTKKWLFKEDANGKITIDGNNTPLHTGNSNAVIFTPDSTTAPSDANALWAHLD